MSTILKRNEYEYIGSSKTGKSTLVVVAVISLIACLALLIGLKSNDNQASTAPQLTSGGLESYSGTGQKCEKYSDCPPCPSACSRNCWDTACTSKCPGSGNGDCYRNCAKWATNGSTTCACYCPAALGEKCASYDDCVPCEDKSCDRKCYDTTCTDKCPGSGDSNCYATCNAIAAEGSHEAPTRCVCKCPVKLGKPCASLEDCETCSDPTPLRKCLKYYDVHVCRCRS